MDPSMFFLTAGTLGMTFAIYKTVAAVVVGLIGGYGTYLLMRSNAFGAEPLREGVGNGGCGASSVRTRKDVVWKFWSEGERRRKFSANAVDTTLFLGKWLAIAFFLESLMIAYIPAETVSTWIRGDSWLTVIGATLVGVPAYLNGYAALPLVGGLIEQGMAPGAGMAFLLAGGVSSIPAAIAVWRWPAHRSSRPISLSRLSVHSPWWTVRVRGVSSEAMDRPIWYLAIAETLVWAGMFYIFPALIASWETSEGWDKTELAAAFTASLIISAIAAPAAGRLIDQGYGRLVLVGSAILGGLTIGALSFIQDIWVFMAAWLVLGVAMAGCLYEPCFAFVTRIRAASAKAAITRITLVAGFAGTVSFPTANFIAEAAGWRMSTTVFAGLILCIAVPLFWFATNEKMKDRSLDRSAERAASKAGLRSALRKPSFWLLTLAFMSISIGHGIIITHLLPLLAERGVAVTVAVLAASCIGPMQVAGRVAMILSNGTSTSVTAISFICMIVAGSALFLAGPAPG